MSRRRNLGWRENEGEKRGNAWGQPARYRGRSESRTYRKKGKKPRGKTDEEKH